MAELAKHNPRAREINKRALNQAAREVLLAHSSDWAFIMTTGTMVDYAEKRTRDHIVNFNNLYDQIKNHNVDPVYLNNLEQKNNIFPAIDYKVFDPND
jgi:1,4-alpha-glucan branching enzyme